MYEGCTGIKTGYTKKSGRCLVTAAERNGIHLIAVTLNAPDDWNDHIAMFDYGFSKLTVYQPEYGGQSLTIPVVGGKEAEVPLTVWGTEPVVIAKGKEESAVSVEMLPHFLYAPVEAGCQVGTIRYLLDGKVIAEAPVTAACGVDAEEEEPGFWGKLWGWLTGTFR